MSKFNLETQYQLYLQRVGLKEQDMHPIQKQQLKHAFMGGIGQLLILQRDDLTKLHEDDGAEVLQNMLNEVGNYLLTESGQQN
jgi:hypothetical protein